MKRTLHVLVNDKPGVLARVAGLFARRGYNIDRLIIERADVPGLSSMEIGTTCDDATLDQVTKQLSKLIDVIKILHV